MWHWLLLVFGWMGGGTQGGTPRNVGIPGRVDTAVGIPGRDDTDLDIEGEV